MSKPTASVPDWNPDQAAELLRALRAGAFLEDAAAFAGLSPDDLRAWVDAGTAEPQSPFGLLLVSVRKARVDLRVANLAQRTKAAQAGNVAAARFLLQQAEGDQESIRPEHQPAPRSGAAPKLAIPGKTFAEQIRTGRMDPKDLDAEQRRQCVLWLESRGMQRERMAEFLGVSRRTLLKDLHEIGKELEDSGYDVTAILGWISRTVDHVQAQARRVAAKAERDKEYAAAASSLWKCWRAVKEYVDTLQSLGLLPKAADKVQIDVRVEERVKVIYSIVVQAVLAEVTDSATRQRIEERVTRELGETLV